MVRLRPVWMTNHPPSVLWHCWLGHQTCKNRRPYNLYCVGADVKQCSINQSISHWFIHNDRLPAHVMCYLHTVFSRQYTSVPYWPVQDTSKIPRDYYLAYFVYNVMSDLVYQTLSTTTYFYQVCLSSTIPW